MGFKCGIVGLPNVGKSTLFNALTETAAADAANYPFCTIEPNVGRVSVPDERLLKLATIAKSAETIPTQLEFVDIAGLVKGASQGEGLGNQFLAHIREVDAVVHVLRCFEDEDITHVEGGVDPIRDAEIIETELILADLESVEKRIQNLEKKIRAQDKHAKMQMELLQKIRALLEEGKPARCLQADDEQMKHEIAMLQLLTTKPMLFVCNVREDEAADASANSYVQAVIKKAEEEGCPVVVISAQIEQEIASLESAEEKAEFLESLGLEKTGLARVIQAGYGLLHLMTFFTVGPKEARAWTARRQAMAPQCAGVIHTDFEKGFIRAETIAYNDYIACQGEQGAKDKGKMRLEGKEYIVKDGDVLHFRFNV